ncbi:MAG: T9SS type A sorting domain-containing protein, partial [Bacteroidota bacterium]
MKYTLLFILAFISVTAFGQVTVEPSPYSETFEVILSDFFSEPIAKTEIVNNTQEEVSLKWQLSIVDAPVEWEYRVCDNNACYSTSTTTNWNPGVIEEATIIPAGGTSLLDLHVLPRMVAGTGTMEISISTTADPDNVITVGSYEVTVIGDPVSTTEAFEKEINVFPNPALDYITLSDDANVDQIVVFNTLGKPVLTYEVNPSNNYRVADLPNGLYLISLISNEEGILRTTRLMKRSVN